MTPDRITVFRLSEVSGMKYETLLHMLRKFRLSRRARGGAPFVSLADLARYAPDLYRVVAALAAAAPAKTRGGARRGAGRKRA